ncbi:hypothetical protein D3C85_1443200 [compost metagenome]
MIKNLNMNLHCWAAVQNNIIIALEFTREDARSHLRKAKAEGCKNTKLVKLGFEKEAR